MSPTYFPLRWESTGDQWWYASPIDYAAANGHYDLVRELLRLDGNHLIKLTSLRRLRRLETVWDDDLTLRGAATCRLSVARRLFRHCETTKNNSLIAAGYGGWLVYTAASAGDLAFLRELLGRNPLLVFGEGEYGVTDVLYAAARSKSCEAFRLLLDYATAPRLAGGGGEVAGEFRTEMMKRAVHAAARGGNVGVLKELLGGCEDVLGYRDDQGCTVLHSAAGRGHVQVMKFLIESYDTIVTSTDRHGNTALHTAAFRGQLAAAEALIAVVPFSIHLKNAAGETFLHKAVAGFQTLQFRRLDRQIDLLRSLVQNKTFDIKRVINATNNEKRTALHAAVIGNVHADLVQLLMTADSIDVNAVDSGGLTPLDYLKHKPRSASSDVLIRQLVSAGAIFGSHNAESRKLVVSRMKMQAENGSASPGSSFRISDAEIFLHAGIEQKPTSEMMSPAMSLELSPYIPDEGRRSVGFAAAEEGRRSSFAVFKQALHWPNKLIKDKKPAKKGSSGNSFDFEVPSDYQTSKASQPEPEPPTPLRKRFSKPSSPSGNNNNNQSNKRTLAVRSNQSSPSMSAKKKLRNGVRSSRSSSFSKSSPSSAEKQKSVVCSEGSDVEGASCSVINGVRREEIGNSKRGKSQSYLCFGNGGVSVRSPEHSYKSHLPVPLMA